MSFWYNVANSIEKYLYWGYMYERKKEPEYYHIFHIVGLLLVWPIPPFFFAWHWIYLKGINEWDVPYQDEGMWFLFSMLGTILLPVLIPIYYISKFFDYIIISKIPKKFYKD